MITPEKQKIRLNQHVAGERLENEVVLCSGLYQCEAEINIETVSDDAQLASFKATGFPPISIKFSSH